jgi:hypothetical protein
MHLKKKRRRRKKKSQLRAREYCLGLWMCRSLGRIAMVAAELAWAGIGIEPVASSMIGYGSR